MNEQVINSGHTDVSIKSTSPIDISHKALKVAVISWASIAIVGQLLFATYVVFAFGVSALSTDAANWASHLPTGYVPGDTLHNLSLISHLSVAVLIMLAGAIQLLPQIRKYYPKLHRWSGRLYITGALLGSGGGLILIWVTKSGVGDLWQHLGISLDAVLIFTFSYFAWKSALKREFTNHRRWALRLFIATNAVWFFRLGLPLWLMIHQKPVGFDPATFTGPFLSFLAFADYLIPLAVLELYFWAQQSSKKYIHLFTIFVLIVAILMTLAGLFGAINILWFPRVFT